MRKSTCQRQGSRESRSNTNFVGLVVVEGFGRGLLPGIVLPQMDVVLLLFGVGGNVVVGELIDVSSTSHVGLPS